MTFIIVSLSLGLSLIFIASMIEGAKIERENPDDPPVRLRK
tara:strand:+ start:1677 stop:1799 length:123 start_codon:yes stop_codon:yes gene_type:complete